MLNITTTVHEGTVYYSLTQRGVAYTLRQKRSGEWELSARRLALGQHHIGSTRYYDTLEALEADVKAFSGIAALLLGAGAGAAHH